MTVKKNSILITCPKCGHMIYGRLWRCPECGALENINKSRHDAEPRQESGRTTPASLRERLKNK